MIETQAGLYVYEVKADTGVFTPGKAFTYVITESVTGGLVSGSGIVESTSITAIAGLAAAAPEAERASKKVLEAVTTLQDVLVSDNAVNIGVALTSLQESVEELPTILAKSMDKSQQAKILNLVADRLRALVGDSEGIDLEDMLEEAVGENPTIKEIQHQTEAIQGVIKFLSQLFEAKLGGLDTPVVSTSLAPGSVKFRIAVANPSSTKVQAVPIHVYLPDYESLYDDLLARTRPSLSGLVLVTPYFIEPDTADPMRAMMDQYGAVVKGLAEKYDAILVDTQAAFDEVLVHTPKERLAGDRVHPNGIGYAIIARAWLKAIECPW